MTRRGRFTVLGGVLLLVVAGGGATAFFTWQARQRAAADELDGLLSAADTELGREELDRSQVAALLRRIGGRPGPADPRLIRAQARLELALGRIQDAFEVHAELAGIDPEPEDLLLSARILQRRHGLRGGVADADSAMRAAEAHAELTDSPVSLFLAWQCALRAGLADQVRHFAERLTSAHAGSLQGRLLACLLREKPPADDLRALEIEFAQQPVQQDCIAIPEELEFALAVVAIDGGENLDEARERLARVLSTYSSWVDARNAAALALHQLGDRAGRDGHLQWLLSNAPSDDRRRATWQALLQQPVAGK